MVAKAFAPAKVNLTLHVTGRRTDLYHELDSLVAFAGIGDHLTAVPADDLSLRLEGPMATGVPTTSANLVLRAATLLSDTRGAAITLEKHLPAAAGIGGGSSDAAAALRLLSGLWGVLLPDADRVLSLGADVPVCLGGTPARMQGIGERVTPLLAPLPPAWLVLANPGVPVPTSRVFRGLTRHDNPPMPDSLPGFATAAALAGWLAGQRNDLESPALALVPEIAVTLSAIRDTAGCLLSRMSGSGATCFGLYDTADAAEDAAQRIARERPAWWVAAAPLLS